MTRIIVHAGYHKTGTTSLQDFLRANASALSGHMRFYGKADFRAAGAHARIFAQRPFPWRLWRFRRSFRAFLQDLPDSDSIILSRETFSGGMPGHLGLGGRRITSYLPAAAPLARVIVAELRRRFGQDIDITFFYTTRDREAWIRSVHGHLLRSIRLRDDFETFRARFPDLKGPDEEAATMARLLAPIPVVTAALEDYAEHPEGPAAVLLDLLDLPLKLRVGLRPAGRRNPGDSAELRAQFLELNRQKMRKPNLKAAKLAAMRGDP